MIQFNSILNDTVLGLISDSKLKKKSEWTRTEKQLVALIVICSIIILLLAALLTINYFVLYKTQVSSFISDMYIIDRGATPFSSFLILFRIPRHLLLEHIVDHQSI